jgi:hypothetical protein
MYLVSVFCFGLISHFLQVQLNSFFLNKASTIKFSYTDWLSFASRVNMKQKIKGHVTPGSSTSSASSVLNH